MTINGVQGGYWHSVPGGGHLNACPGGLEGITEACPGGWNKTQACPGGSNITEACPGGHLYVCPRGVRT